MRWQRYGRGLALAACLAVTPVLAAVDVNQAPADDLVAIKGIGPGTSAKILQARQAGPFRDWNDFIHRVPGIGPATAAKLSAQGLTVNGQRLPPGAGVATLPTQRQQKAATPPPADTPLYQPMVPKPLLPSR